MNATTDKDDFTEEPFQEQRIKPSGHVVTPSPRVKEKSLVRNQRLGELLLPDPYATLPLRHKNATLSARVCVVSDRSCTPNAFLFIPQPDFLEIAERTRVTLLAKSLIWPTPCAPVS